MEQVDSVIHHQLSRIIARDIEFPPDVLVTLTRVKTARDLAVCKVWITVLPAVYVHTALSVLIRKVKEIEQLLSHHIQLKKNPRLIFMEDVTGERALEMEEILDTLKTQQEDD